MLGGRRHALRPEGRLAGFAAWAVARRHRVLGATAVLALLFGLLSLGLEDRLSTGGLVAGGTESARADALLSRRFQAKPPDLVLRAAAPEPVDSARVAAAGGELTRAVSTHPGVTGVRSYWTARVPGMRGTDGRTALLTVDLSGDDDRASETAERLVPAIDDEFAPLTVSATGPVWANVQTIRMGREDLHSSEAFILPTAVIILLIAFRSAFVAICPAVVGGVVVVSASAALWLLTHVADVSVFAPNLATALGFGLALDYSLFLISRYREELAHGIAPGLAVQRAMSTAGRTVLFSALTVALATSSLLAFPLDALRSLAWTAIIVVLLAATVTLVLIPPMLVMAGPRIEWDPLARLRRPLPRAPRPAGRLRGAAAASLLLTAVTSLWAGRTQPRARATGGLFTGALLTGVLLAAHPARRRRPTPRPPVPADSPAWRRIARTATRSPVLLGGGCAIVLLLLALPFMDARFGVADERMLPADAQAHATARAIDREFAHPVDRQIKVLLAHHDASRPGEKDRLERYARRLAALPGIVLVRTVTGSYDHEGHRPHPERARQYTAHGATLITLSTGHASQTEEAGRLLERVRAVDAPSERLVTGPTARAADTLTAIGDALLPAAAIITTGTLVLLFLFTGGLLVSVKALVLGALSLTASCGAIVAVFQNGHLRALVGDFTVTGHLEVVSVLLAVTVAFGLSVDYEVFLLSRIKEQHRATGDHTGAIVTGIARTGRLVTVAALAVAVSVGFLVTSSNTILKLIGFGIALAVLMDATLVRGLLVPAFMRLTGPANWWAPATLARLHRRIGLTEPELTYPPGLRDRLTVRVLTGWLTALTGGSRRDRPWASAASHRDPPGAARLRHHRTGQVTRSRGG